MRGFLKASLVSAMAVPALSCVSSGDQNTINDLFKSGGANTKVQLCKSASLQITGQITFTASGQELSTDGYPTDTTRATIQVSPGHNVATMVSGNFAGLTVRSLQLDGNRRGAGAIANGGAILQLGGTGTNQLVQDTKIWDPVGVSALHVVGSGSTSSPCGNVTIKNNQIGPCGLDPSNAMGQWADGITLDCTNSVVQGNTIVGATNNAIAIYGSPNSVINSNTISSSDTNMMDAAISMLTAQYSGSYENVVVSDNTITGVSLIKAGIPMGSQIWSQKVSTTFSGPVTISGNKFTGNIALPIGLSGWKNGIKITGNDASGVPKDKSSFSNANTCSSGLQEVYKSGANFAYDPATVNGTVAIQPGFYMPDQSISNVLCFAPSLTHEKIFEKGLDLKMNAPMAEMVNANIQFQADNNLCAYDVKFNPYWCSNTSRSSCTGSDGKFDCELKFDGDLSILFQGSTVWSTKIGGLGNELVLTDTSPWIAIVDANNKTLWDTQHGSTAPAPAKPPKSMTIGVGYDLKKNDTVATLDGGSWVFQADVNFVGYRDDGSVMWAPDNNIGWDLCWEGDNFVCEFNFGGNLTTAYHGSFHFNTGTATRGAANLTLSLAQPYAVITGQDGQTLWDNQQGVTSHKPTSLLMHKGYLQNWYGDVAVTDGVTFKFQTDGNFVGYTSPDDNTGVVFATNWYDPSCTSAQCTFSFDSSGNLFTNAPNRALFNANTGGKGETMKFSNSRPYVQVLDINGNSVWSSG